jgi:hypothetical protein
LFPACVLIDVELKLMGMFMSATDGILFRRLAYARDQDTLQDVKRYCKKEREVITDTEEFGGCLNLLHEDLRSVSRSVIEVGKIVVASISRSYSGMFRVSRSPRHFSTDRETG